MSDKHLGLGVMIGRLFETGESAKVFTEAVGKTIAQVSLIDNELVFEFLDKSKMRLFDSAQSCCESRYMSTDDDLSYYAGATLLDADIKEAPNISNDWGEHEVEFLEIRTSKGVFTIANHNEHNGYYGGFNVIAKRGVSE